MPWPTGMPSCRAVLLREKGHDMHAQYSFQQRIYYDYSKIQLLSVSSLLSTTPTANITVTAASC